MLRIHDILGWIRIQIRIHGSMPLTNRSGSGSSYFRHWPSRWQQKQIFKKKLFCLLLFEGIFTWFFKDKKSKRSRKGVGIKVFLLFLLGDRRIWIHTSDYWIRIQKAQKHTDPTDLDPQHCFAKSGLVSRFRLFWPRKKKKAHTWKKKGGYFCFKNAIPGIF